MNIRLNFNNFWNTFNKEDNIWIWALKHNHNVVLDDKNPNLVISNGGNKPFPNAFTIYFSSEPYFPKYEELPPICDYSISSWHLDIPNYTRFTLCYLYIYEFIKTGLIKDFSFFKEKYRNIPNKTNFCCFITRSMNGKRGQFFEKLNKYKKVDSNFLGDIKVPTSPTEYGGSFNKINFIKKYKFNLAFENNWRGSHPSFPGSENVNGELKNVNGYITEKIIEPLVAGTIPIYWGNELIDKEINSKTFLNYYDYENEEEFIEKIIELDNDDDLYNSYFENEIVNLDNDVFNEDYIVNLFDEIIKKIK